MEGSGLEEQILTLRATDELDLGEVSPRDEEEKRDDETDDEAEVNVDEDGDEEGRDPDEGLGEGPLGVADEVFELEEDAEEGDEDDGRQDRLERERSQIVMRNSCVNFQSKGSLITQPYLYDCS